MKKSRKVSISISLPLERLVYLTQRVHDTDMSTSEYVEMLLVDDAYRQHHLEDMIEAAKNCTPEEIAASTGNDEENLPDRFSTLYTVDESKTHQLL